jgi:acyl-homoserine-lactone acylase
MAFAALVATLLPATAVPALGSSPLSATIRWTSHGIPHILAKDFAGLGYGYGYAFASQDICVIADQYVTVDGQRSRYFGPTGSWVFEGNGFSANNLNSDFFFQQIVDDGRIEKLIAVPPPLGPRQEIKDGVRGYAAGYNRYLADTGVGGITDPACSGKPWVHPITEIEVYRRFYELALLASSAVAIDGIGSGAPSCPGTAVVPSVFAAQMKSKFDLGIGSNAVALGSDATQNGHGMLLGNPHFPWHGSERFFQAQMTIPGVVNVSGGSLFGVPIVLIGHTDSMAWSHTVSTAYRFTPYQLAVAPGETSYFVDGGVEAMTKRTMTVQVQQPDGSLQPQSRTLYRTRWGPMLTSLVGLPLPWCHGVGFAMADANEGNFRYVNHFLETDLAHSSQEELQVLERNQGVPWVNTLVSDNTGQALYADISVVPNVPDSMTAESVCGTPLGTATIQLLGLPVLDGSKSACAWRTDPDAVAPGIFGPSHLPHLFRTDYTENSNDSYWLANPRQRLEGFARIIGDQRTARALRTRLGLTMLEEFIYGHNGKPISKFTPQQLMDMVFNDRQYGGELAQTAAADMCDAFGGTAPTASGTVAVDNACTVIRNWDRTENLNSKGAVLWREFWTAALKVNGGAWSTPFNDGDPAHTPNNPAQPLAPVDTPNTLDTSNDPMGTQVKKAFGDAVKRLKDDQIPLDATLGSNPVIGPLQFAQRGATRIPIHGGPGTPGTFNAINERGGLLGKANGYGDVPHGSSFVQVVSFNGTPCPDTHTILTYSQSTNPNSPYYADQTQMFSNKQWVTDEFCESQILADPNLTVTSISDAAPAVTAVPAGMPNTAASLPAAALFALALVAVAGLSVVARRSRA